MDPILTEIWRFVRGDSDSAEFERWLYAHVDELSSRLDPPLLQQALSANYRSADDVRDLKASLRGYAAAATSLACRCVTLPRTTVIDMGVDSEEVLRSIESRVSRGERWWWLWAGECTACAQWWLVGQEERQNDVYCLRRLGDEEVRSLKNEGTWPSDFDTYEALLRLGRDSGRRVVFADPYESSLTTTIADLASARPGISVSAIASLLNLEMEMASALARRVVVDQRVSIGFDEQAGG